MRSPETALEEWLARDGWNQIDRGRLKERARNRLILAGLCVPVVILLLIFTGETRSMVDLIGIGGSLLFLLLCAGLLVSALRCARRIDEVLGPLTPSGKALLTQVLKKVVGPNNTLAMEPDQEPPPETQVVQGSISEAMTTEELALLEPLFREINNKMTLKAAGDREPPLIEWSLPWAARAAFNLAADMRGETKKKEEAISNLIRLKEIVAGYPIEYEKGSPESEAAMRTAVGAWFDLKKQLEAS